MKEVERPALNRNDTISWAEDLNKIKQWKGQSSLSGFSALCALYQERRNSLCPEFLPPCPSTQVEGKQLWLDPLKLSHIVLSPLSHPCQVHEVIAMKSVINTGSDCEVWRTHVILQLHRAPITVEALASLTSELKISAYLEYCFRHMKKCKNL